MESGGRAKNGGGELSLVVIHLYGGYGLHGPAAIRRCPLSGVKRTWPAIANSRQFMSTRPNRGAHQPLDPTSGKVARLRLENDDVGPRPPPATVQRGLRTFEQIRSARSRG